MTDKQIIIDDVDVSGCSYGEIEKDIFKCSCEYNVRSASMFCKDNPNCYYKNWKRKEQECEELKKEKRNFYNFLTNKYNYGSFRPMWGAYLLKHFFKKDLGDFFDEKAYEMADTIEEKEKQIDQLKAENEHLSEKEKEARHYLEEAYKFKQALRDIIEIAKPQTHYINIKQNKTASEVEYDYANIVWNLEQRMYKIIQKCEVLDE